jgi:serine/threonine protein kinase
MSAQLPPDSRIPEEGSRVGSWIVLERVGGGTHGVVFRAVHADRPEGPSYALKVARQPGDPRFEREATLLSRIRHPGVPRFEDQGVWTSPRGRHHPYFVMQWVEGVALYKWAEAHGVTLRQAIGQLAQVARALEATHEHGVHRDVKGDNVWVDPEGRVVLLDFGCCWYQGAAPLTDGAVPPGTEQYRSPALQLFRFALYAGAGRYYEAEAEDDVYALGVTAYRLLASTYPSLENAGEEDIGKPIRVTPPRGVAERCPELSELILRMLSEDPQARGSAGQIARELERLLRQVNPLLDAPWIDPSTMLPTDETVGPESEPELEPEPVREPELGQGPEPESEPSQFLQAEMLFQAGCATAVIMFVLLLCVVLTHDWGSGAAISAAAPQGAGSTDAGAVGVGDEAMATVSPAVASEGDAVLVGFVAAAEEEEQADASVDEQAVGLADGGVDDAVLASAEAHPPYSVPGFLLAEPIPKNPEPGQKKPPCKIADEWTINGGCYVVIPSRKAPCEDFYEYDGRCYTPVMIKARRPPTSEEP